MYRGPNVFVLSSTTTLSHLYSSIPEMIASFSLGKSLGPYHLAPAVTELVKLFRRNERMASDGEAGHVALQ